MIEDIFGDEPIDLIIRFHPNSVIAFNQDNSPISFEELVGQVYEKSFECYFQKITDTKQKISVTIAGYHVDFVVIWQPTTFSYEAVTNGKPKTVVKVAGKMPDADFIQESCLIKIIDIAEPYRTKEVLEMLHNRVSQLNIPINIDIAKENEIWFKYIDAMQKIITKRQAPFAVKKYYPLQPIDGTMEKASRFRFKVDLIIEENKEYRDVEKALKKLAVENARFGSEGSAQLTYDDIIRVLDPVLEREFQGVMVREKEIGCIINLYRRHPLEALLKNNGFPQIDTFVRKNSKDNKTEIIVRNIGRSNAELVDLCAHYGLQLCGHQGVFRVANHGADITKNVDFNKKNKISFQDIELGHVFPMPTDNTFILNKVAFLDLIFFKTSLEKAYGKQNIIWETNYVFGFANEIAAQQFYSSFDFVKEIKKDLYALNFVVDFYQSSQSLFFKFTDLTDLVEKINALRTLNGFDLNYKSEGFKYKVRTKIISRKTHLNTLRERIEKLGGVEFEIDVPKQKQDTEEEETKTRPKREKRLPIGMLSRRESNIGTLIFTASTRYAAQKKAVKQLLALIEGRLPIGQVFPNLTGDAVKIQWLREAVGKLMQPTDKPNGKPVNPKLKDFIFDSSKAEEIFDKTKIEEGSSFWHEVEKSRISKTLNTSQLKAILSALYATDLCLLQGPPGTGKTTVISEIIWQHIRQNANNPSGYKILLTSETNLAVDNALEKLVGIETTIVKPLRFGKAEKFEEEGKKYSLDRIMRWVDEAYENQSDYENEQLETDADGTEDDTEREDLSNNAVQRWMLNIGNRAHRQVNPKYAAVIRDWQIELALPTKEVKMLFKDKYLKYANVIGSTCSSCGSSGFKRDYNTIFNTGFDSKKASELLFLIDKHPESRKILELWYDLGFSTVEYNKNNFASIRQTILAKQHTIFDAVIMDEASKATPPEMVLPLCFGKKSIIIGDHKQLPPMINEKDFKEALIEEAEDEALANEIGHNYLKESQFKRLITNPKVSPTIRATFDVQYRMHSQIGALIQQFYPELENGLICGIAENENIEDLNNPASRHHGLLHEGFINPQTHVMWVDTPEPETKDGTSRTNEAECETVKQVLKYLKHSEGFDAFQANWDKIKDIDKRKAEQEVGIISFYGNQIKKLKEVKKYAENELKIPIRLNTVDKFQGMERNILIVSTVRSSSINDEATGKIVPNTKGREGGGYSPWGFADSPERLNVALSRARRLLIIVGNRQHFANFRNKEGEAIYANVISQIAPQNIIHYKTLEAYK